ncbi:FtsX-like permease family protein [Streptomyces sp. NPDC059578]|uniref:ABC transporter permease n=1 Tax=Streptomyces sp. NPDC059578 TaxID=3346874 RepID=UPI003692EC8E
MTATDTRPARPRAAGGPPRPAAGGTSVLRDLAMGMRFALTGGRESWVRTVLTAVGVGLGVSLLLLASSVPDAMAKRDARSTARSDFATSDETRPQDNTLLLAMANTDFREGDVRGRLLQPEGPNAPLPPGLSAFPAPGEMAVSPALRELLESPEGKLLRERIPYEITATVDRSGLIGPHELAYYAGSKDLDEAEASHLVVRLDSFGTPPTPEPLDPVLMLLVLIILVVLLMPVAVFVAAAVRFGGERRDRRLAALRLVGADSRMIRRIAAGEAVAGALLGLVVGAGLFLAGRQLAARMSVQDMSVFPEDLTPTPLLAALVVIAVPLAAIGVTLLALRGVVIEPLGVMRAALPRPRRLLWRLLLPLVGLLILVPQIWTGSGDYFNTYMVVFGTVLLLFGVTALLPWVVEAVVARIARGPVAWQLATRRLQLSSGTAARMVNGIAVAVAGAIALQMLFAGVDDEYTADSGHNLQRAQMELTFPSTVSFDRAQQAVDATTGVRSTVGISTAWASHRPIDPNDSLMEVAVGDCAALREVAKLPSCRDGDVFRVHSDTDQGKETLARAKPGATIFVDPPSAEVKAADAKWRLPEELKKAEPALDPLGYERDGILATPGAFPESLRPVLHSRMFVQIDKGTPDAMEHVRTTAAKLSPFAGAMTYYLLKESNQFASIRTGLFVGATCVLLLIGASLLVSQIEQLRERKKLLAVLVAFGTRRRTLAWSVLWQTAVPVALGLVLAVFFGLVLGMVLLLMVQQPLSIAWSSIGAMTGVSAGVVLLVTALSMPALIKLMRPEGLRTE